MQMLELSWLTGTAAGWTDTIPVDVLVGPLATFQGAHLVAKGQGKPVLAYFTCHRGRTTKLDYGEPFTEWNLKAGMDVGVLTFDFEDDNAVMPSSVSWDDEPLKVGVDVQLDTSGHERPGPAPATHAGTNRPGQAGFRAGVLTVFGMQCCVTKCKVEAALDAAHIRPFADDNEHANCLSNGLALRADLHRLFDAGLIAVDPAKMRLHLAPEVASDKAYASLNRKKVRTPKGDCVQLDVKALRERWTAFEQNHAKGQ